MTLDYQDESPTLAARVDPLLEERVEEYATLNDVSKSEVLRKAVKEYLPDDIHGRVPQDSELRDAYLWLKRRSNPTSGTISGQHAVNNLAQEFSKKPRYVKSTLLDPLQDKGWIEARAGTIAVRGAKRIEGDEA